MKKIIEITTFVDFVKKNIESDKVRDYCHLTGPYGGAACSKCNNNITQKQSKFFPFICHNFSVFDCHIFFRKRVDKKNDKVKFDIIPKTNEKYNSVRVGLYKIY